MKQITSSEYDNFNRAMDKLLKADPAKVRERMKQEKIEREEEARRTGKRGRGRPPKPRRSSASARVSS